uniref:Armadillo repeat containing 5 n=1 Tax=Cyprinus carpio carpio TaxID=630221 RepID=A0A8C0Y6S0_CYPCA
MSTPLEQGVKRHSKSLNSTSEVLATLPESSLTWCLAQLSKTRTLADSHSSGLTGAVNKIVTGGDKARDADKRLKAGQWRALLAIRTQHIKGGGGRIARYQSQGGLPPLLDLLRRPESSRKFLDLALSILANCCTERQTRLEVRKLDGISVVVDVLRRNVSVETVQNRAARALGNLAMDPEGSAEVHSAGGVPLLLLCLSLSPPPSSPSSPTPAPELCAPKVECVQSAARALVYLSDTPANRLLLLSQGALPSLALFIAPEYPLGLQRASLRAIHELTRGCSTECAREMSRSGALTQLGVLASGEGCRPLEELALKTLANLCSQGCLRPLVGSLGVIQKFAEEVKKDPLKSGVFFKALCLCCREAVNRAKVKESGGLEVLISFLSAHQNHPLTRFAILACVDFVYDESALEQLQELGLVPLLIKRLVELTHGEEPAAGKIDASLSSGSACSELMTSCFESFDFSALEGNKREDVSKDQMSGSSSFLSLRSWLVSEGLISSEGELTESPCGNDDDDDEDRQSDKCWAFLAGWLHPLEQPSPLRFKSLYVSLLIGCLSSLLSSSKEDRKNCSIDCQTRTQTTQFLDNKSQPQQNQSCPYLKASHDLTFLLDDGTLLLANHEAVTGEDGAKDVGSEYFRALLMGGFGEAQKAKGEAIRIKDVNTGMLSPVLHYLHGCRWSDGNKDRMSKHDTNCLVLSSLASHGLLRPQDEDESCSLEEKVFQKTPLAEVMIGACRFLVPGLQRSAEELSVDLLYSVIRSLTKHCCSKNGMEAGSVCKGPEGSPQLTKTEVSKCSKQHSKCSQSSKQVASSSLYSDTEAAWLRSLLPQVYWFSQRYSYLRLGQACLSILLRPQGLHPAPLQPSLSTDCFLRLAQEADCAEGLRQDILNLIKTALS